MSPKSNDRILTRDNKGETRGKVAMRRQGRDQRDEARDKKCLASQAATRQMLDRGRKGSFLKVFGGSRALPALLFQTSGIHNFKRMNFYCFKPPNLCQFVVEANKIFNRKKHKDTHPHPHPLTTLLSSLF